MLLQVDHGPLYRRNAFADRGCGLLNAVLNCLTVHVAGNSPASDMLRCPQRHPQHNTCNIDSLQASTSRRAKAAHQIQVSKLGITRHWQAQSAPVSGIPEVWLMLKCIIHCNSSLCNFTAKCPSRFSIREPDCARYTGHVFLPQKYCS